MLLGIPDPYQCYWNFRIDFLCPKLILVPRIVDLTLRKLKGEDVSDEIEEMERKDAREEINMLLDMLKIF